MSAKYRSYYTACRPFRGLAAKSTLLIGFAGLAEGLALMLLIPVLDALTSQSTNLPFWTPAVRALGLGKKEELAIALIVFGLCGAVSSLSRIAADLSKLKFYCKVEAHIRRRMGTSLMDMAWPRFLALRLGDINVALNAEASNVATGAQSLVLAAGSSIIVLVLFMLALFISPSSTVYTLAFGAAGGGIYVAGSRFAKRHALMSTGLLKDVNRRLTDVFGNFKFFRISGHSTEASATISRSYDDYARCYYRTNSYPVLMRSLLELLGTVYIASYLFLQFVFSQSHLPSALAFITIFYRLIPRLLIVYECMFQAQSHLPWLASWEARQRYAENHAEAWGGQAEAPGKSEIRLKGLCYTYPGSAQPTLENLDMTIAPGQFVAIVGHSGSGKSTIVDLVAGLLPPVRGSIQLDGRPLESYDLSDWQRSIGIVPQENPVFHGTVLENVAWGMPQDAQRCEAALRQADAWEFTSSMPGGIHAVVGEKGGQISGGQRQRIALARALYKQSWLLILDEAASALDSMSEDRISKTLEDIRGQRTIIMVTHRLQAVRNADQIYVLSTGRLVEQGSFNELMALPNGELRSMARLQNLAD